MFGENVDDGWARPPRASAIGIFLGGLTPSDHDNNSIFVAATVFNIYRPSIGLPGISLRHDG
jgi:hypothetical protein